MRYRFVCISLCLSVVLTAVQPLSVFAMESEKIEELATTGAAIKPVDAPLEDEAKIPAVPEAPKSQTTEQLAVKTPEPGISSNIVEEKTAAALQSAPKVSHIVITEVRLGGDAVGEAKLKEYVTLNNTSAAPIDLTNWQIQYAKTTLPQADCSKDKWTANKSISGSIPAGGSVKIEMAMNDNVAGSVRVIDNEQFVHDTVGWGSAAPCFETVAALTIPANNKSLFRYAACDRTFDGADTNDNAKDFTVATSLSIVLAPECTIPPDPPKVNYCSGIILSEIGANRDDQFIEIYNTGASPVDLNGCMLQTNRSTTKSYVFGSEVMQPGAYSVAMIKNTDLTLTKTTVGTVYFLSSDGKTETDAQTYVNLASDTSWARFTDGWQQTYAPTPGLANLEQAYVACDDGYVRNESTGRCNKIVTETGPADCGEGKYRSEETGRCRNIPAESILAACKLGQYRSEETGRCRNLVTASAVKPCKEGQYRSEETNRCRNIATTSTNLKPCKENQYRSEETNRCRNLPTKVVPAAAYGIEPVKDGTKAFVGWWALGGITLLAVGYAAWEWQSEVRGWIRSMWIFGKNR